MTGHQPIDQPVYRDLLSVVRIISPEHGQARNHIFIALPLFGKTNPFQAVAKPYSASQAGSLRWEDYTNIVIDPSDDCTFWFVGNYLKSGATSSTTRIGSFMVPGCR